MLVILVFIFIPIILRRNSTFSNILMWIFGYGSLMWYQDFPFEQSVTGVVKGYSRRFWQLSPDHRGTPDKPGRTVTLVEDEKSQCWGIAFKVAEKDIAPTRAYLDHREKAGYSPDEPCSHPIEVEVYMNIGNNDHSTGPSEIEKIAQTILISHGPSGPNLEYALRIADVLHKRAPHVPDYHVFELEKRLLELSEKTGLGRDVLKRLGYIRYEE